MAGAAISIAALGLAGNASAALESGDSKDIVIEISPFISEREQVLREITSWMVRQPRANVSIFDAWEGTEITRFTVPEVQYFSEKAVVERIGSPLLKLGAWHRLTPSDGKLAGSGTINLPQLLGRITQTLGHPPARLIVIGSPVLRPLTTSDANNLGRFNAPDIRLLIDQKAALYSGGEGQSSLKGTKVTVLFPNEDASSWPSRFEDSLRDFFACLCDMRGGSLVCFSPDLSSGLRASANPSKPLRSDLVAQLKSSESKLARNDSEPKGALRQQEPEKRMPLASVQPRSPLPVPADVASKTNGAPLPSTNQVAAAVQPATDTNALREAKAVALQKTTPVPVAVEDRSVERILPTKAGVTIQIRYRSESAQADLFVRPHDKAEELSFKNVESNLGVYASRFHPASMEHAKWINFPHGLEPGKAEIWINYSSGIGRLAGKAFWVTPEGLGEVPFSFAALNGGDIDLKRASSRRRSSHWVSINLHDLIAPENSRATANSPSAASGRTNGGQTAK